jgi:hypothetical protein
MTRSGFFCTVLLTAAVVFGQGPEGPRGWRGDGPRMASQGPRGPEMMGPGMGRGGGPGGMGLVMAGPGARTPVTGAPFAGVEVMQVQQKFADGNTISRQDTTKLFRDSQGRVRMEHTTTPPGSQTAVSVVSIFDPVAGYSYVLNPADQTARKMAIPPPPPAGSTPPAPPQDATAATKSEDLGTQVVNGVPATGTRVTTTIAAGAIGNQQPIVIVRETWIATVLKVPVMMKSSDPRFGSNTMNLTAITQNEPDPALFQVPAAYTVSTGNRMGASPASRGNTPMRRGGPRN